MEKLTKKQLIKELQSLQTSDDAEIAHGDADSLLLRFINDKEVTDAFDGIPKWYA